MNYDMILSYLSRTIFFSTKSLSSFYAVSNKNVGQVPGRLENSSKTWFVYSRRNMKIKGQNYRSNMA
jgi:hypothetical protein